MRKAGWYQSEDSDGTEVLRWWDGSNWSEETRVMTHEILRNENDFMFSEPTVPEIEETSGSVWNTKRTTHNYKSFTGLNKLSKRRKLSLLIASGVSVALLILTVSLSLLVENNFGNPTDQELLNIDWAASESPNIINNTLLYDENCDPKQKECDKFSLIIGGTDTFSPEDYKTLIKNVSQARTSSMPLNICLSDAQLPIEFQRSTTSYEQLMIDAGVPRESIKNNQTSVCASFNPDGSTGS